MHSLFDNLQVQAGKNSSEKEDYKIVSVRLRWSEYEGLDEQAKAFGLTNNMALRIAIRRIGGFLEIDAETSQKLDQIVQTIGEISSSIRHISDVCERKQNVDMTTFTAQKVEFSREFRKLDGLLNTILNTAWRRSDGKYRLEKAMTQ